MYFDNLADVKNYCNDIVCFYSDNDPYVKYEVEKEFADTITENQIMISGGGHLNSESVQFSISGHANANLTEFRCKTK